MKILHLDIETSPAVVYTWALFNQNITVDQIITPTSVLCWAAKWQGEKEVMFQSANGKLEGPAFVSMIKGIHKLLCEADAVCHYNGTSFDIPRLNQEFAKLGLSPPPPIPQIDLKKTVMSKFGLVSSKLAFVGPYFKIGEKVKNSGWALWISCLKGEKKAWAEMEKYNRQDVVLLEELYEKVLPWVSGHPNSALYAANPNEKTCPKCGKDNALRSNGLRTTATCTYRRMVCRYCNSWAQDRKAIRLGDPVKTKPL